MVKSSALLFAKRKLFTEDKQSLLCFLQDESLFYLFHLIAVLNWRLARS